MSSKVQFLWLLLALLAVLDVGSSQSTELEEKQNDAVKATIDKIFDAVLPFVRKMMKEHQMDPMQLHDYSDKVLPLPGELKGHVELTNGWLQQLSTVKRQLKKHVTASYYNKRLVLDLNLAFLELDVNYTYNLRYLLIKRTGDVYFRLKDAEIQIVLSIDMATYKFNVDSFRFTNTKMLEMKLEGRKLDPLVNVFSKIVTTLFRKQLLPLIEKRSVAIANELCEKVNRKMPVPHRKPQMDQFFNSIEF